MGGGEGDREKSYLHHTLRSSFYLVQAPLRSWLFCYLHNFKSHLGQGKKEMRDTYIDKRL